MAFFCIYIYKNESKIKNKNEIFEIDPSNENDENNINHQLTNLWKKEPSFQATFIKKIGEDCGPFSDLIATKINIELRA